MTCEVLTVYRDRKRATEAQNIYIYKKTTQLCTNSTTNFAPGSSSSDQSEWQIGVVTGSHLFTDSTYSDNLLIHSAQCSCSEYDGVFLIIITTIITVMVITIILWCDVILLGGVYMFLVSFPFFFKR